jgi:hypothetical protein
LFTWGLSPSRWAAGLLFSFSSSRFAKCRKYQYHQNIHSQQHTKMKQKNVIWLLLAGLGVFVFASINHSKQNPSPSCNQQLENAKPEAEASAIPAKRTKDQWGAATFRNVGLRNSFTASGSFKSLDPNHH